jgi:hypothetical protein
VKPDRFQEVTMAQASTMSYEVVEGWEQLPAGWEHRDVAGVAVDAESRVYLICRGEHPIIVYDRQGNFIRSWGEGEFTLRTHGITVGPTGPSTPPMTATTRCGGSLPAGSC